MKNFFCILIIFFVNIALAGEVLVLVDGKAITDLDVQRRIDAIRLVDSELRATDEVKRGILSTLINEELCFNEARRLKVKVSFEEVIVQFNTIAQGTGITKEKLDQLINNKSLYQQVENQVLWNDLVSNFLGHKIKVSDAEIREEQKLSKGIIKEVTFKNIFFSSIDPKRLEELRLEANSCESLDSIVLKYNLPKPNTISLSFGELNSHMQSIVKSLPENKLSEVVDLGIHKQLIMVCNKNIVNNPRDVKLIKNELINKKMNAEAQKYLAELKKRVHIEYVYLDKLDKKIVQ